MKSNGGPAFPGQTRTNDLTAPKGMSLRDWFAGQALVGIYAGCLFFDSSAAAEDAYKTADAMLKERKKGNDSPG